MKFVFFRLVVFIMGLLTAFSAHSEDHFITFHVISPPSELDFTDVSSFFISLSKRSNKKTPAFPWGHSIMEVHCTDTRGVRHNLWTQYSTGQYLNEAFNTYKKSVLEDGEGLAFVYLPVKGLVETENASEIPSAKDPGVSEDTYRFLTSRNKLFSRWRYTKIKINPDICSATMRQILEFRQSSSNNKYILGGNARDGQGANCTSYTVGFIESLGLLPKSITEKWDRQIIVPQQMLGSNENPAKLELNFFSSSSSTKKFDRIINWNKSNEPAYTLHAMDPWLYAEWINEKIKSIKKGNTDDSFTMDEENGILIDDTNLKPRSTNYFINH